MSNRRLLVSGCLAALVAWGVGDSRALNYPEKPVRLVTAAPGAAGDFVSRMIAPGLSGKWGQTVLVDIVRVTYKGGAPALNAPLSGETLVMFATASGGGQYARSGGLRALAVTSATRSALFPDLPTLAESGLPGYQAASTMCVFAPGATSAALVRRINQDIVQVLGRAEVGERFLRAGSEVVASSPQELETAMKADMAVVGKLVKDAGIRTN